MYALMNKLASIGVAAGGLGPTFADFSDAATATGTTQADAYDLNTATVRFTVVPAGSGVRLENGSRGDSQLVINDGANDLAVYPPVGQEIGSAGVNVAYVLAPGESAGFVRLGTNRWNGMRGGVLASLILPQFTTYADVAAYNGNAKALLVTGYRVGLAPDPIAGLFVRNDADTTSADNQGTILRDGQGRRWWRAIETGYVNYDWFRPIGDGTSHPLSERYASLAEAQAIYPFATSLTMQIDAAALQQCLNWAKDFGRASSTLRGPLGPIQLSNRQYMMGTWTFEMYAPYRLNGTTTGDIGGGAGTVLKWDAGAVGMRFHRSNTFGEKGTGASVFSFSDSAILDGIQFSGGWGAGANESLVEGDFHGISMRARVQALNCKFSNWQGAGVAIWATAGAPNGASPPDGNANNWLLWKCRTENSRDGIFIDGSDVNQGTSYEFQASRCRRHGIWDSSFLGNLHINPLTQNICRTADNYVNCPGSVVEHLGSLYYVRVGQAVGASTNAPTGAATSNTWWGYLQAGSVSPGGGIIAWFNGINVREGYPYYVDNVNAITTFLNPYREADASPLAAFSNGVLSLGGQITVDRNNVPNIFRGELSSLVSQAPLETRAFDGLVNGFNVVMGSKTTTDALRWNNGPSGVASWRIRWLSEDCFIDYNNLATNIQMTGPNTAQQFGTGAAVGTGATYVSKLMIGDSNTNARQFTVGFAAPSANLHAQGEWRFNRLLGTDGNSAYHCTVTGTPGTWQALGMKGRITAKGSTANNSLLADQWSYLRFTNAGANTYTVQPNATVAHDIGTEIDLIRASGTLAVVAGAGVTINSRGGLLNVSPQWGKATLKKVATDTWDLFGDLA